MSTALKRYAVLFLAYLRPHWKRVTILTILLFGGIALQVANPQILRSFIDGAMKHGFSSSLIAPALLFLGIGFASQIVAVITTYVGADVGWRATNALRVDLAAHCLDLDMSFHNERTPGELIERIDGDILSLSNFFSQFVIKIAGSALMITSVLVILTIEEWRLGLVLSVYAVLAVWILHRYKDIAVAASADEREASAAMYGFIEERLAGIDDIRANGGGAFTIASFYRVATAMLTKGRRSWVKRSMLWVIIVSLFTVGDMLSLGFGTYLFSIGAVTIGTVYLFFQYTQLMWGFIEELTHQLQDLQKAGASIVRVEELLRTSSGMRDGHGAPIPEGALEVRFDETTFAYGDVTILDRLDFQLAPGTVLGLLGRTGSGKTTLTRLLFRLYDPQHGAVRLAGVDLREAGLKQLRQRVAMVTQEVQLFHASVRDNLTFFNSEIADGRIVEVIDDLGFGPWLRGLPKGLDTVLGAGGAGISAGEAQLLAFVRVFLRDPGLVILDEPSSRMDLATERLLEEAMTKLLRGRTAIIIAHRLSTVARADEIMILEDGAIREHGRRAELVEDSQSRFSELLRAGLEQVTV